MELLSTALNAAVVIAVGAVLTWVQKGRLEGMEKRLDARMEGLDARIDGVERRLDGMQASIDALRSDLTQVALAVGAGPRAENA